MLSGEVFERDREIVRGKRKRRVVVDSCMLITALPGKIHTRNGSDRLLGPAIPSYLYLFPRIYLYPPASVSPSSSQNKVRLRHRLHRRQRRHLFSFLNPLACL
ncbi:hypothetical protein ACFX2F_016886 [Malus domestica]